MPRPALHSAFGCRNLQSIEALLQEHYPWTLPMFKAYDHEVKRADMGRAFILHHFGGLYLDIDCQCFRDPTDSLTDYDFVIQGWGSPARPGSLPTAVKCLQHTP